ncbi:MAG: DUF3168 domain-containing protein [Pseudomonadota bacterium]|jgi:hypothetical protein
MELALKTALLAFNPLTALVGTTIDWGARPQGKGSTCVVLHRIGGERGQVMAGPDDLIASRVQVDCWGPTYNAAKAVAVQVVARLNGYRAGAIQRVFIDSERDDQFLDPPEPLYRTRLDLRVWHTQA